MSYEDAYSRTDRVLKALTNRAQFTSDDGSAKYLAVYRQTDPLYIGEDDKERHIFSINFLAPRTPVNGG